MEIMYLYHIQVFTPMDKLTTSPLFREEFIEEVEFHTETFFSDWKKKKIPCNHTTHPIDIFIYFLCLFLYI